MFREVEGLTHVTQPDLRWREGEWIRKSALESLLESVSRAKWSLRVHLCKCVCPDSLCAHLYPSMS